MNKVEAARGTGRSLAVTVNGMVPTKSQTVATWSKVFNTKVTGHSARRTGALAYIRDGWEVGQVAYLGRWKSGMILEYAKEALESMPVNRCKPKHIALSHTGTPDKEDTREAFEESRRLLQNRVNGLKNDVTKAKEELTKQIKKLEERTKGTGNLPKKVRSTNGKLIHCNMSLIATAPLFTWKTRCGWYYGGSSFSFVDDDEQPVDCQKCKAAREQ